MTDRRTPMSPGLVRIEPEELIRRLRERYDPFWGRTGPVDGQAADLIEKLVVENRELKTKLDDVENEMWDARQCIDS